MMSLYYKPFGQSGSTFQNKGVPFHPVNFCFIDVFVLVVGNNVSFEEIFIFLTEEMT